MPSLCLSAAMCQSHEDSQLCWRMAEKKQRQMGLRWLSRRCQCEPAEREYESSTRWKWGFKEELELASPHTLTFSTDTQRMPRMWSTKDQLLTFKKVTPCWPWNCFPVLQWKRFTEHTHNTFLIDIQPQYFVSFLSPSSQVSLVWKRGTESNMKHRYPNNGKSPEG